MIISSQSLMMMLYYIIMIGIVLLVRSKAIPEEVKVEHRNWNGVY
jgi:hypothetical protein